MIDGTRHRCSMAVGRLVAVTLAGKAKLIDVILHTSLSFLNVALTKSSESRSLRLQHHAEVKRWSCSFRPWCRRAHRRRPWAWGYRSAGRLSRRMKGDCG